MKSFALIFFPVIFFSSALAQGHFKKMDLKSVLTSEVAIREFIDSEFTNVNPSRVRLLEEGHPLSFEKFNKEIKSPSSKYFIYDLPISNLFALKEDFCFAIYLLVELDLTKIKHLTGFFGFPENIESEEEINTGSFRFLTWTLGPIKVWLDNDVFGNSQKAIHNSGILLVTNMKRSDLIDKENISGN